MTVTSSHLKWETAPLFELIHFIVSTYHGRLRGEFPQLIALADRVEKRHRDHPSCPCGLREHLELMHRAVIDHLAKEERVLFPMILEGYGARTGGPVRVMEMEHDEHRTSLARLHELAHSLIPPADASDEWVALYRRLKSMETELLEHIHLEDEVLFPRALVEE